MFLERLSGLALPSIENERAKNLDFRRVTVLCKLFRTAVIFLRFL